MVVDLCMCQNGHYADIYIGDGIGLNECQHSIHVTANELTISTYILEMSSDLIE